MDDRYARRRAHPVHVVPQDGVGDHREMSTERSHPFTLRRAATAALQTAPDLWINLGLGIRTAGRLRTENEIPQPP